MSADASVDDSFLAAALACRLVRYGGRTIDTHVIGTQSASLGPQGRVGRAG